MTRTASRCGGQSLINHGGTLPLQLVLVRCGVPVGANDDRLAVGLENNVVVVRTLGGQTDGVREEPPKRKQHRLQEGPASVVVPRAGTERLATTVQETGRPWRWKDMHLQPRS